MATTFAAAVAGKVGLEEWTDILSGIDLLIADGVADPDRLGIGGASHGGFMAAWAVGQTDRFKAALMDAGISDWGMLVATGEQATWEAGLGGSAGWEGPGPHRHDRLSPISFASKISTPVLILHGENDTNVPLSPGDILPPRAASFRRRARVRRLPARGTLVQGTQPPARPAPAHPRVVRPMARRPGIGSVTCLNPGGFRTAARSGPLSRDGPGSDDGISGRSGGRDGRGTYSVIQVD